MEVRSFHCLQLWLFHLRLAKSKGRTSHPTWRRELFHKLLGANKKGTRSWQWIVYAFCWGTHISVVVAAMHLGNFCMPSLLRSEAIAWVCRNEKGMWNSGFFSVTLPARLYRSPLHLLPPASADDASIWGPKVSGCMSVSLSGLLTDGLVIIASVYFWYPTCLFWKWKLILVQFQVCTKVTTHLTPLPPIFELIIFMH